MLKVPKNWPKDLPVPPPLPRRWFEDEKWLMDHELELAQQYPDQWVAVVNKEVVAVGKDAGAVEKLAREKTGEEEFPVWLVAPIRKVYSSHRVRVRR
jgi:hypothetical protein